MKRILFVCTGNTCRSPMAEAMLRQMAAQRGITVAVRSAGVSTVDGLPVSAHAVETLRQRDIEHNSSSRALTSEAVNWADLILTMTSSHKRGLLQWYPEAVDKTHTLKEYANQDAGVLADIEELERLYSELHMKQALGQQLTADERNRLLELERRIPSVDIADPFGGTLAIYNSSAQEIEAALRNLLDKLTKR
ncbi:protein-tyrosine phosphatase [Paenibacillus castaneae]|uniref:low molecular weight protein arginine phosphatase n=1 Tax=Paenibacillus castaneae TaxID=474957 RepID=UPI000C99E99D|nr:low molecular weight protein arginine phosphatase [Paenibacillus castaneae]NIK79428.1 protein-tyrosine phosphatase [Paenibacillus castaneae]